MMTPLVFTPDEIESRIAEIHEAMAQLRVDAVARGTLSVLHRLAFARVLALESGKPFDFVRVRSAALADVDEEDRQAVEQCLEDYTSDNDITPDGLDVIGWAGAHQP